MDNFQQIADELEQKFGDKNNQYISEVIRCLRTNDEEGLRIAERDFRASIIARKLCTH